MAEFNAVTGTNVQTNSAFDVQEHDLLASGAENNGKTLKVESVNQDDLQIAKNLLENAQI